MSGGDLKRTWRLGEETTRADLHLEGDRLVGVVTVAGGEEKVDALIRRTASDAVIVRTGGRLHRAVLARQGTTLWVAVDGHTYELRAEVRAGAAARSSTARFATSPMTGTLLQVAVQPGDRVVEGQVLFVVEAMKMEYAVRAPRDATVARVTGATGGKVKVDDTVVGFEDEA